MDTCLRDPAVPNRCVQEIAESFIVTKLNNMLQTI